MSLKILYITTRIDGYGGLQKVQAAKWNYWTEYFNYDITVLVTNSLHQNIIHPLHPKVKVIEQHPEGGFLKYIINYKTIVLATIANVKPDFIVVTDHGYKAFLIPFFVSKKIPIFFESHGAIYTPEFKLSLLKHWFYKKISILYKKYCIKKFTGIITLTHKNAADFNHKNSVVLPNPLLEFPTKIAALENKIAIAIGRNSYEKGYDLLLHIWKKVIEKHPDWVLELYTSENHKSLDLRGLSKKLQLEKNIHFCDSTPAITEKILNSSLHFLPSRSEGFGLVILETMACGVPTVAFDCPVGPGEIISNATDGILVKPFDIEDFATKICYLIENIETRKKIGKNAIESVKKYEFKKIMNQWKSFFEGVNHKFSEVK